MAKSVEAQIRLSLVDRISEPIKRLSARISNIANRFKFDRLTRSFANVGRAAITMFNGIMRSVQRATAALGLFGVSAMGAFASIFHLSKGTATAAKEIGRLSELANTPAIQFQQWSYGARTVGIEAEKLSDILKDVGDKFGDFAQTGGGPLKDFFEKIAPRVGLTKKAFQGLSSADALQLYVKGLEKANLSQAEMIFYLEAIASDATLLLPLLKQNGKAMRQLGDDALKSGNIMDDSVIQKSKEFGLNWQSLMERFEGFKNLFGAHMLPVLDELTVAFRDLIDANKDLIRSNIKDWAKRLSGFLKDLMNPTSELRLSISKFTDSIKNAYASISPFLEKIGVGNAIIGALAAVILGPAIFGIGAFVLAITQATIAFASFSIALLANPIVATVTAVALLAAGIYVLIKRWDEVKAYFTNGWADVTAAFDQGFIQGITKLLETFNPWKLIAKGVSEVIEYFTGIDLYSEGERLMKSFEDGLKAIWGDISEWFTTSISSLMDSATGSIKSLFGFGDDGKANKAPSAAQAATAPVQSVANAVTSPASAVTHATGIAPAQSTAPASGSHHPAPPARPAYRSLSDMPQRLSAAVSPSLVASRSNGGSAINDTLNRIKTISADSILVSRIREAGENNATKTERNTSAVQNYEPLRQEVNYTIDNSLKVGAVNVNVSGMTEQEGQSMVRRAINDLQKQQAANLRASLSD